MQISVLHPQCFQLDGLFENKFPSDSAAGGSEQLLEKPLSKGQEGGQALGYKGGSQGLGGQLFGKLFLWLWWAQVGSLAECSH